MKDDGSGRGGPIWLGARSCAVAPGIGYGGRVRPRERNATSRDVAPSGVLRDARKSVHQPSDARLTRRSQPGEGRQWRS
jgi:hypothetical protein